MGQNEEEAAKAALAAKRKAKAEADAALEAKIEQDRRDVPPGIEETDADVAHRPPFYEANAAFVKAQSEFEPVTFDKTNPHFKNKYASLGSVLKATLPALNRNGIALVSQTEVVGGEIIVTTLLMYGGLIFARTAWPVGKAGTPPQQLGSALTYARRYTLQSLLGVAAEEDDDGNAATPTGSAGEADPF